MMRWFRTFIIFARTVHFGGVLPKWEKMDSVALAHFLSTPTGVKLRMHLDQAVTENNNFAVQKATPWHCGWACGYKGFRAFILSLTEIGSTADNPEDQTQDADPLEHLRP